MKSSPLLLAVAAAALCCGCKTTPAPEPTAGDPARKSAWPDVRVGSGLPARVLLDDLVRWADEARGRDGGTEQCAAAWAQRLAVACRSNDHRFSHACAPADDAEHYRMVERAWLRIDREIRSTGAVPPSDSKAWSEERPCSECAASVSPVGAAVCLDHADPR